jgi:hypothetical protein
MPADFTGVWKLNPAKSKPANGLTDETMRIEPSGSAYRSTIDSAFSSGEKLHQQILRTYDGKERPATGVGFSARGYTEVCRQLDASTRQVTQKRDGKIVSEINATLSADGKVMTSIRKGGGDETLVFDRQ